MKTYEAPTFVKQVTLQSITATNNNFVSPFFVVPTVTVTTTPTL